MLGKGGSEWGVAVRDHRIVAFRGTSYDGRDAAADVSFDIPESVFVSGWEDVAFARVTGTPSARPAVILDGFETAMPLTLNSAGIFEEL